MKEKTAVQKAIEEIDTSIFFAKSKTVTKALNALKLRVVSLLELEKKQIVDAYKADNPDDIHTILEAERYFTDTYEQGK